ncbi:MAG: hypothetical protein O3A01_07960 [bacterium]|nr:hypothetical protein [bacterium]
MASPGYSSSTQATALMGAVRYGGKGVFGNPFEYDASRMKPKAFDVVVDLGQLNVPATHSRTPGHMKGDEILVAGSVGRPAGTGAPWGVTAADKLALMHQGAWTRSGAITDLAVKLLANEGVPEVKKGAPGFDAYKATLDAKCADLNTKSFYELSVLSAPFKGQFNGLHHPLDPRHATIDLGPGERQLESGFVVHPRLSVTGTFGRQQTKHGAQGAGDAVITTSHPVASALQAAVAKGNYPGVKLTTALVHIYRTTKDAAHGGKLVDDHVPAFPGGFKDQDEAKLMHIVREAFEELMSFMVDRDATPEQSRLGCLLANTAAGGANDFADFDTLLAAIDRLDDATLALANHVRAEQGQVGYKTIGDLKGHLSLFVQAFLAPKPFVQGACDDERNTDNSFMKTVAQSVHVEAPLPWAGDVDEGKAGVTPIALVQEEGKPYPVLRQVVSDGKPEPTFTFRPFRMFASHEQILTLKLLRQLWSSKMPRETVMVSVETQDPATGAQFTTHFGYNAKGVFIPGQTFLTKAGLFSESPRHLAAYTLRVVDRETSAASTFVPNVAALLEPYYWTLPSSDVIPARLVQCATSVAAERGFLEVVSGEAPGDAVLEPTFHVSVDALRQKRGFLTA